MNDSILQQLTPSWSELHAMILATYLAIAAMRFANGSDKYALRNGLYVLSPLSDGLFTLEKPSSRKEF